MFSKTATETLRSLANNATPGPWTGSHVDDGSGYVSMEDQAFIAAAREAVPALLDEIDRLQRTVDRKDEQMGDLQGEVERLRSTSREWEVKCDNRVAAMELAQAEVERLKRETQKAYERMETVIRETTRIVDEANAPAARLALLEGTVEDLAKASMVIVRKLGVDGFTTVGSIWDEDMHEAVNAVRRVVSAVTPDKP